MEKCPLEVWHEIFALAWTDAGLTGRSLSLVSRQFYDISGPLRHQCLAITRWGQLIAFAQTFPHLPHSQKKIKYLFIHLPYPFLDVDDNPRLADERPGSLEDFASEEDRMDDSDSDSDSDSDYLADSESDSESGADEEQMVNESEDVSLGRDEKQELCEDNLHAYLSQTREDEAGVLDHDIQVVFDKGIRALHAILNETSSTLKILTLYWTSFKSLPIHEILPPLPLLEELHLFRSSIVEAPEREDLSTTALFPRLHLFFLSGDLHHRSPSRSVAIIAPNLTHFRFTRWVDTSYAQYSIGDIIVKTTQKWATDQMQTLADGTVDKVEYSTPIIPSIGELPEIWKCLWSSRVAGRPEAWGTR